MKKLSFDDIKAMNNVSIEEAQMHQVFGGGYGGGGGTTLDTVTVTPSGSKNDGDDHYDGE